MLDEDHRTRIVVSATEVFTFGGAVCRNRIDLDLVLLI